MCWCIYSTSTDTLLACVFQVPRQADLYSCGLHALWHVKHLIHFGEIRLNEDSPQFSFTPAMNVKRAILAEELLSLAGMALEDVLDPL